MIVTYETEHYIFHFLENSLAERDIIEIAKYQEQCYNKICDCLGITYQRKIGYWLYNSPQLIGDIFFDGIPCNGLSVTNTEGKDIGRIVSLSGEQDDEFIIEPYSIHAVYEENIKCIGEHEDTHVISAQLCEPDSAFLCEGLAMFMDGKWWGIENKAWTKYYKNIGELYLTSDIIGCDEDDFYELECGKVYPIAGAWTEFMFQTYGAEKYLQFYCCQEYLQSADKIFGKSLSQIHRDFDNWLSEIVITEEISSKIKEKIGK
ncbi:MAG: hypothetical protein J1E35_07665 [Lachnospiraceae bacterium]|nr:hypothetical protein [Lachnospiraceae bacterium]